MENNIDELKQLIQKIIDSNTLIIVEGKKDRAALEKFGINNIIELSKKPLYQVVEEIVQNNKECIVLTDLDNKGKELYGKLSKDLQKHGIKINNKLRDFLFKNTKIRQVEGLANLSQGF